MWKQSLQTENMMTSCRGNAQLGKSIFVVAVDIFFDHFFFPFNEPKENFGRFPTLFSNVTLRSLLAAHYL